MTGRRAQVSTEMLSMMAVLLVFIAALMMISSMQAVSINQAKEDAKAKNALSDLSGAAKEVYSQGYGAKKRVYVDMPSGINPANTSVSNKSIRINSNGNDYVTTESFDLRGTLPVTEGGHLVWVVSEGNKVRIGYAMIELSKQVLLVTMKPNDTKTTGFEVTNVWAEPINVSLSDKWDHDSIYFSLDSYYAALDVDGSESFSATFTTQDEAIGIYTSEINMIANDANGSTEYVRLPVILQVVPDPNLRPPLFIKPAIFNATINRTESSTRSFQVCTNEVTKVSAVKFIPSVLEPGEWTSGTEPLGPIDYDSCVNKELTVTVPHDAFYSNHTGFVRVEGEGNKNAKDSLALLINVGGGGDNEGPDVFNITTGERRVHEFDPTTIYAIADDTLTGNSPIKGCLIVADNGTAYPMFPSDGSFDNETEPVHYTYYDGFDTGRHIVRINCTDRPGNVGPTRQYNFTIGKHILFVVASGNESEWSDWIDTYSSGAGYSWSYDIADFDDVLSGAVDLYYYDIVIFLAWKNDNDFLDKVVNYSGMGGYLGLFGPSAHQAVRDLGIEWHPDNPHVETHVNILNNSHYVTQGFSTGMMEISPVYTKTYLVWNGNSTNHLGASGWFYPDTKKLMLAEVNGTLFWGVEDPWRLSENGIKISTRVIDYMINQSTIE